jgi:hypothetical protein
MQVRIGSPRDMLSRAPLPVPDEAGWLHLRADELWSRARAWAASEGLESNCHNVPSVAPL